MCTIKRINNENIGYKIIITLAATPKTKRSWTLSPTTDTKSNHGHQVHTQWRHTAPELCTKQKKTTLKGPATFYSKNDRAEMDKIKIRIKLAKQLPT